MEDYDPDTNSKKRAKERVGVDEREFYDDLDDGL